MEMAKLMEVIQNLNRWKPVRSSTILGWRRRIDRLHKNLNYLKKQQHDWIIGKVFECFGKASQAVAQQISDESTVWCKRLSNIESD
jgi:hypothetical protein